VAVSISLAMALTGCSGNEPSTPAVSGDSPGAVTVPTLPPTTNEAPAGTVADEDNQTPTTVDAED
jgi:hypothetical protein